MVGHYIIYTINMIDGIIRIEISRIGQKVGNLFLGDIGSEDAALCNDEAEISKLMKQEVKYAKASIR